MAYIAPMSGEKITLNHQAKITHQHKCLVITSY